MHLHKKIGIKQTGIHLRFVCSMCGKCLEVDKVLNSLYRELGNKDIEYWRKLRYEMEKMRIEKRRGVSFEGIWLP